MNDAYKQQFANVKLYRSDKMKETATNFEYLFNLTQADGTAPAPSSLFNLDTFKKLLELGENAADIIENKSATLDLTPFNDLTKTLGLDQNEQTYLIYMWLKYTIKLTLFRTDVQGTQ